MDLSSPSDLGRYARGFFTATYNMVLLTGEKATLAYADRMEYTMGVRASWVREDKKA